MFFATFSIPPKSIREARLARKSNSDTDKHNKQNAKQNAPRTSPEKYTKINKRVKPRTLHIYDFTQGVLQKHFLDNQILKEQLGASPKFEDNKFRYVLM